MERTANRIAVLDCLRGVAAVAVVLYHFTDRYFEIFNVQQSIPAFKYGYLGVNLFFIISGFVIFMTVNDKMTTQTFFLKRFSRLYPAFLFSLGLTYLLVQMTGLKDRAVSFPDLLLNITMIPEFFAAKPVDGAYWSLLPEFFFYSFIALLIAFRQTREIIVWCLAWLTISYLSVFLPETDQLRMLLNVNWSPYFIAGIMFYLLFSKRSKTLTPHWIIALCFMRIIPTAAGNTYVIMLYFLCFLTFYLFIYGQLKFLVLKPLLFLGTISYPLYLIHQNIGYILLNYFKTAGLNMYFSVAMVTALMILCAYAIHIAIEKPMGSLISKRLNRKMTVPIVTESDTPKIIAETSPDRLRTYRKH